VVDANRVDCVGGHHRESKHQEQLQLKQRAEADFKQHQKMRQTARRMLQDLKSCKLVCESLDVKIGKTDNALWTKQTAASTAAGTAEEEDEVSYLFGHLFVLKSCVQDVDIETAAAALPSLLQHLRTEHTYCFFCAVKFKDADDLKRSCPGVFLLDHEEDEASSALDDAEDSERDPRLLWSKPG
jgi:hypothetical protein